MTPHHSAIRRATGTVCALAIALLLLHSSPAGAAPAGAVSAGAVSVGAPPGPARSPASAAAMPRSVVAADNRWARPPDRRPLGWALVVHGGGWQVVGPATVEAELPTVRLLARQGWGTYTIDYRPGEASLADVEAAYDLLRRRVGLSVPVCAIGDSAGGNLAMLLAAWRPSLHCVISEGGPTDLVDYPNQAAWVPVPTLPANTGPTWIYNTFIVPSFGTAVAGLRWWSPVTYGARTRARMLLGGSTFDDLVPEPAQLAEMKRADPSRVTTMLLPGAPHLPGATTNFTHANVTLQALASWRAAEFRMLRWAVSASRETAVRSLRKAAHWAGRRRRSRYTVSVRA